jgi:hypothetical protein
MNQAWKYLVPKPKSNYRQLFVKDRWIAARTLYGQTIGEDARTPIQVATDFDLPLEAVEEAIAYCQMNPPEIFEDWRGEEELLKKKTKDERNSPASASNSMPKLNRVEMKN